MNSSAETRMFTEFYWVGEGWCLLCQGRVQPQSLSDWQAADIGQM